MLKGDVLNEPVGVGCCPRTVSSDGGFDATPERSPTPDRTIPATAASCSPLAATSSSIVPQCEEPRRPTHCLNPTTDRFQSHFLFGTDDKDSSLLALLALLALPHPIFSTRQSSSRFAMGNESPLVRRPSTPNKDESSVVLGDDGGVALESIRKKKLFQRRMVTPPGGSGSVSFSDFIRATAPAVEASAAPALKKVDPAKVEVVAGKSTGKHRVY
ncbi:hypothetical protein BJ742DRAFT_780245 [Cladochytrium replicatum]|nr:hypothetical protein BJ742DRAFT_780245 [Cladochytrium replicatum]